MRPARSLAALKASFPAFMTRLCWGKQISAPLTKLILSMTSLSCCPQDAATGFHLPVKTYTRSLLCHRRSQFWTHLCHNDNLFKSSSFQCVHEILKCVCMCVCTCVWACDRVSVHIHTFVFIEQICILYSELVYTEGWGVQGNKVVDEICILDRRISCDKIDLFNESFYFLIIFI